MGKETKLVVKWSNVMVSNNLFINFIIKNSVLLSITTPVPQYYLFSIVQKLEKSANILMPQSLMLTTKTDTYSFSMFLNFNETYKLCSQLATSAMKSLGFIYFTLIMEFFPRHKSL